MRGLCGSMFDFNHDGKISAFESAAELGFLGGLAGNDDTAKTELELSGLDPDELEFMDAYERRAALKGAGLNPDEYDF